jgi:hypothetical protein
MAKSHNFQIAAGYAILSVSIANVITSCVFRLVADLANFAFNNQTDLTTLKFISEIDRRHAVSDEHRIAGRRTPLSASLTLEPALLSLRLRTFNEFK